MTIKALRKALEVLALDGTNHLDYNTSEVKVRVGPNQAWRTITSVTHQIDGHGKPIILLRFD